MGSSACLLPQTLSLEIASSGVTHCARPASSRPSPLSCSENGVSSPTSPKRVHRNETFSWPVRYYKICPIPFPQLYKTKPKSSSPLSPPGISRSKRTRRVQLRLPGLPPAGGRSVRSWTRPCRACRGHSDGPGCPGGPSTGADHCSPLRSTETDST